MPSLVEVADRPLADIGLEPRVLMTLRRGHVLTVGDVFADPKRLLSLRRFGPYSLNHLRERLKAARYWPDDVPDPFQGGPA